MSYQLRHKDFGVYQGSCLGFGFWHPMSEMPEQGLCKFNTIEDVKKYKDFLCSEECFQPLNEVDLTIESFDYELDGKLHNENFVSP